MKWIAARLAWHDAFYTPGKEFDGQTIRGTKVNNLSRMAHCVEAGQVMCAIDTLPKDLKSLGMVLWAPFTFITVQDFNRAWELLVNTFWKKNTDPKLKLHSHKITILAKHAIEEYKMREAKEGGRLYTLKHVFTQAGIDPSNANKQGWVLTWDRLLMLVQELAGEALRPVSQLLIEKREAIESSKAGEVA